MKHVYIVSMDYSAFPNSTSSTPIPWQYYVIAEGVEEAAMKVIADRKRRSAYMAIPGGVDAKVIGVELMAEVVE